MKIGLIGAGQMGSAMLRGFVNSGKITGEYLIVKTFMTPTTEKLKDELNFTLVDDYSELTKCDIVIVATGKNGVPAVLKDFSKALKKAEIPVISINYGVTIAELQDIMGEKYPLAKCVPNIPVTVNKGVLPITYATSSKESKQLIEKTIGLLGTLIEVPERQIEIVGSVAGCSPAFVDIFIEAMADAAVINGIKRELAYEVISEMMVGAAAHVAETKEHPAVLKDAVCAPGGVTVKGVAELEKCGFRNAVISAVNATM
ncbi:MAG: pyrroline-5-carboxylate reductase [Micrococcaceae bacterium]